MATLSIRLLILIALKATATAEGTPMEIHGSLPYFFHWVSNEEIPTLTFAAEHVYIDATHTVELKLQSTYIFLCELVC
jgi:hypothetical protein